MKRVGLRRLALVLAVAALIVLLVGLAVVSHDARSRAEVQPEEQKSSEEPPLGASHDMGGPSTDAGAPASTDRDDATSPETTGVGISSTDYHVDAGLEDSAAQVLEDYRDRGDCLLRQAGYLDLLGKTWGCVIEGPEWVDIVVLQEQEAGSTKRVTRLDSQAWESELGKLGP